VQNIQLSDNMNGLSINMGYANDAVPTTIIVKNSFIGGPSMTESYSDGDDSCQGFTGIRLSTVTMQARSWPVLSADLPFFKPAAGSFNTMAANVTMSDNVFKDWSNPGGVTCKNVTIFRANYFVNGITALT
jgi:hypothetical protein